MKRLSVLACLSIWIALGFSNFSTAATAPQSRFADVNGVRLHYLTAGKGDLVVLLRGYAETSHM